MEKIIFDSDQKLIPYMSPSDIATNLIAHLLKLFSINKKINLRNILKFIKKEYKSKNKNLNINNIRNILTHNNFLVLICFDFLIGLLGEPQVLKEALEAISKTRDVYSTHFDKFNFLQHIICLVDNEQHSFSGRGNVIPLTIDDKKLCYRYINSAGLHKALLFTVEGKTVVADDLLEILIESILIPISMMPLGFVRSCIFIEADSTLNCISL